MLQAVLTGIGQFKAFRQLHIQLDSTALPSTADGVGQMEVNLRTIESTVTFVDYVIKTTILQRISQTLGCQLPGSVIAHGIFRTGRQFCMIFQTEGCINLVKQTDYILNLATNLAGHHKDMRIILSKATYTEQSVQSTAELMTVYKTKFTGTDRQFLIGMRMQLVNQHTTRTVHRFNSIILLINLGEVHVFFVMIPVTGGFPKLTGQNHRGFDFFITITAMNLTPVVNQLVTDNHAVRQEEWEAGAFIHNSKQIQFLAQLTMVTFSSFFQHMQISIKLFLAGECSTINALQHFVLFVTAPVSTCNTLQFKCFYSAGRRAVRTGTEVGEITLGIGADDCILRQVINQLNLIFFIFRSKHCQSFTARQFCTLQRNILFNNFCHFLFDSLQILRSKGMLAVQIIVEAVGNSRTDSKFNIREQMLNSLSHNVCSSMTDCMQPLRSIRCNKFYCCIMLQLIAQILVDTVNNSQQSLFTQLLGNTLGNVQQSCAGSKFLDAAIFQSNLDISHNYPPLNYAVTRNIFLKPSETSAYPPVIFIKNKNNPNPSAKRDGVFRGSTLIDLYIKPTRYR